MDAIRTSGVGGAVAILSMLAVLAVVAAPAAAAAAPAEGEGAKSGGLEFRVVADRVWRIPPDGQTSPVRLGLRVINHGEAEARCGRP